MKVRLIISIVWVAGTLVLFGSFLYAAHDYERKMAAAVTGKEGVQPSLDRVNILEARKLLAKTRKEADPIIDEILLEKNRYSSAMRGAASRRQMIQRATILWILSALVPVCFLWSPHLLAYSKRLQPGSTNQ